MLDVLDLLPFSWFYSPNFRGSECSGSFSEGGVVFLLYDVVIFCEFVVGPL